MTRAEIDLLLWRLIGQPKRRKLIRYYYARLMALTDAERQPTVQRRAA